MSVRQRIARARAVVVLVVAAAASPQAFGQALELQPVWGGRFAPGRPSEVRARLLCATGGDASLSLQSSDRYSDGAGGLELRLGLDLVAGVPSLVSIPVHPGPDGRIEVEARLPDGTLHRQVLTLAPNAHKRGLVAISTTVPAAAEAPLGTVHTDPADLPRLAQGYGPLSGLALAPSDLTLLDPQQTQALGRYLGACGALALAGASAADLAPIRAASGCAGRAIVAGLDRLGDLSHLDPGRLAQALVRAELASRSGRSGPAPLLLVPYGLLLAGLLLRPRASPWLLALPPLAALLLWQGLSHAIPPARGLAWIEMESGGAWARLAAVLRLDGDGHARRNLPLGAELGLPASLDAGTARLHLEGPQILIGGPQRLFDTQRFLVTGAIQAAPGLTLASDSSGFLLRNDTSATVAGAWLSDGEGGAWPLSDLPPGTTAWKRDAVPASLARGRRAPPADMPRTRSPALVLPWPGGEGLVPGLATPARAWLILYPADGERAGG